MKKLRASHAQECHGGRSECRSVAAQHDCQNKVRGGCGQQNETKKRLTPIDFLDNEVPILREADLVREFEKMSAGWRERERSQHERNECICFKGDGRRSALSDLSAWARRPLCAHIANAATPFPRADPV